MGSCWIQQPGCVLLGELLLAVGRARGWLGSLRGAVSLHVGSVRNKSCPFRDAGRVLWSFGLLKNN